VAFDRGRVRRLVWHAAGTLVLCLPFNLSKWQAACQQACSSQSVAMMTSGDCTLQEVRNA